MRKFNILWRFLIAFIGGMLLFYLFYYSPIYEKWIMPGLLNFQAKLASFMLGFIGEKTHVEGDNIIGDLFKVSIRGGCDGLEATALYLIALIALPVVSLKEKMPAILYGLLILFVLNIFRIALLYYSGIYWPKAFELLHLHGGVIIFMMISVLLWLIWVNRIINKRN
ncbi:MAG: archaeosortase/exosortase family protein [Saprospiraceae bacterium]|nr:archaeosortase/exosortase family protein [Saprospiraceae bacterium]